MENKQNPYAARIQDLPDTIAVFPLSGVLLLPGGQLPLNIFEPRYVQMVNDAMSGERLIGMIQPNIMGNTANSAPEKSEPSALQRIGCAGKITEFSETEDGRYLITLTGISRFTVKEELQKNTPYRQVRADWSGFSDDLASRGCLGLDRNHLHTLLKTYFVKEELECDWQTVEQTSDNKLITCLSMICPFDALEKQALLEAECCRTRGKMFIAMLEMAISNSAGKAGTQH